MGSVFMPGCGAGEDESVGSTSRALCSAPAFAVTPTGPAAIGSTLTLTATGSTCGTGETAEYRFLHRRNGSVPNTYTTIRDWGATATASWNTAGLLSGVYDVIVQVRAVGTTTQSVTHAEVYLGTVCPDVTINTSVASPQAVGTAVTVTGVASCTGGTPEYEFQLKAPGASAYTTVRAFGTGATYAWSTTGLAAGVYTFRVNTRAQGNGSGVEGMNTKSFELYIVGPGGACTALTGTTSPTPPVAAGTQVTITGAATGCTTPQYAFYYRLFGDANYTLIRTFGAASVIWNTTGRVSGSYQIRIDARAVGSSRVEVNKVLSYSIGGVCNSVTLARSPASPQIIGTAVTLTGTATCSGGATAEYKFLYKRSGDPGYTLLRDWGTASVVWDTSDRQSGNYTFQVQTRAVGSTSSYEGVGSSGYTLDTSPILQIAASLNYHTCAAATNGLAYCWGLNDQGQLGNGTTTDSGIPLRVSTITGVTAVATGGSHSCALLADHTVQCWGMNDQGQLGNNSTTNSPTPVAVSGITDATAISAGTLHTCALHTGGTVSCWGNNSYSQLANSGLSHLVPIAVPSLTGVTAIASGGWHQCALLTGGTVDCWGLNSSGQIGDNSTTERSVPTPVTGLSGVSSIAAGDSHTCSIASGALSCWGDNTYSQIGNGNTTNQLVPVALSSLGTVTQVAPGFPFSCARSAGAVKCWGHGDEGELGNGSAASSTTPVSVSGVSTASSIAAGGLHTCVVLASGAAQCWGYNSNGQLGNGTTTNGTSPVTVTPP